MALWGEPGAMIDGMYTLTSDDLTCNNKHTLYALNVQATVRLHEQVNGIATCTGQWYLRNLYRYVCHESWDIAKQ